MKSVTTSLAAMALLLSLCLAASAAQTKSPPIGVEAETNADRSAEDDAMLVSPELLRTMTGYRDNLVSLLKFQRREFATLNMVVKSWSLLLVQGKVTQKEFDDKKLELAKARKKIAETRQWIAETETLLSEAEVLGDPLMRHRLPPGGYSESKMLMRYDGNAPWLLADAGKIENFFYSRFHRRLPVSARGLTNLHRQMNFDHSNAMDVALSPDSVEGRTLIDHLRGLGIPFLAFRGKVAGSSTGAHIHIGKPSLRLSAP